MKLKIKKLAQRAFTLIEMIGVLAVIAILAALLIPKIFDAIYSARVNNATVSCETVKTAIADHYAKFGGLLVDGSGATPASLTAPQKHFDQVLLKEAFLDKLFAAKIGDPADVTDATKTRVEVLSISGNLLTTVPKASNAANDAADGAYDLDGSGGTSPVNDVMGSAVVQVVITGVLEADAKALNDRLDGTPLGVAAGSDDLIGRVKYLKGDATTGKTAVYVYLTHR